MSHNNTEISESDLTTIIMSVVHEVKNSLLLSSSTLEALSADLPKEVNQQLASIQHEINSANQSLIRMLTLYKMRTDLFSLNRDQHNVYDFLEDIALSNTSLLQSKNITIKIYCDEYLEWFFDRELISSVVNTIINNCIHAAKNTITIYAEVAGRMLDLRIEDNGDGYPSTMLDDLPNSTKINFSTGRSGLGLYFSEKIANLHHNGDQHGFTRITNLKTGGGCFNLFLP